MTNTLNNIFQALSDPTRRRILQMLNEGDKNAGEIASAFAMSAPSVSHHLSVLKNANLVTTTHNGQSIVYSLNTTVMHELLGVMMELFKVDRSSGDVSTLDAGDTTDERNANQNHTL